MKRIVHGLVAVSCVALAASMIPAPAGASVAQPHVVSDDPVNYTPNVEDDGVVSHTYVNAFAQIGNTMYAGGTFHTVMDSSQTTTYVRNNLMSFDATTGALTNFAPNVNGQIYAIVSSGNSLYIGGYFTTVNGVARAAVAKLDATTGAVDTAFDAGYSSGHVTDMHLVNGRLIVSGNIHKRLEALNPTTGANTGYLSVDIAGTVAANAGGTRVYKFAVNPAGTRLVGIGNFTTVGGLARSRAFMLDLGATSATVNSWYYQPLTKMCRASGLPVYLKGVDFSPDGSYFVMDSTGYIPTAGGVGTDICDAAARFETNIANPIRPTWINYTGGDSLTSIAATGAVVYVQGHQRCLDNPNGTSGCLAGSSPRPGIGAIDPVTGKALSWNPTKTRGVGGRVLFATSSGLWVGSDGALFNQEHRNNIAFVSL